MLSGHPVTQAGLRELLGQQEVRAERHSNGKVKAVNIRPFVRHIRLRDDELLLLLEVTDRGTARPEEVVEALGCRPGVHYLKGMMARTHVNLSSSL
jgi:hypothetical protein